MKTSSVIWESSRIKHLARIDYGLGQPPRLSESGIPILRATNINRGKISATGLIYASLSDLPTDRAPLLRAGEILVVRSGAYTGDSALVTGEWAGSAPGYDLRITPEGVEPRYLAYCLLSSICMQQMDIAKSRAAQPHLNAEELGEVVVDLPERYEQSRIADFLDAETARIDAIVAKRRQVKDLLILKRGRIIDAGLGFNGRTSIHNLVPLKFLVAEIVVGIVITPAKWYVENGGVPALRGLNVQPGRIVTADLAHISDEGHAENLKSRLQTGDVVVVRTGQAGAAAIVPASLDGANCIDLILVRPGSGLSPEYLEYVLNSDYARERVSEHAVGSIQAHFNVGAMKQIPVPLISRAQQEAIVHSLDGKVDRIDQLLGMIKTQETLLGERRQALITAAVTGQIDVSTASGRGIEE